MKYFFTTLFLLIAVTAFGQQHPIQKINISHLTKNFYVCVSYGYPDGDEPFPANCLFAVTDKGIILINTPWGDEQTQQLVDSVQRRFNKKIVLCIATHFHDDCVAGFDVLKKQGTKTYTSKQTYALAKKENNELPQYTFTRDTTFTFDGVTLQTWFPGEGHTRDNIVVWFPQDKILFGGCLVKSLEATTKGFTGDANLKQWPLTIDNVGRKFADARYVIPGHQGWQGSTKQLRHTQQIIGKQ
ncbi:subclass B1 metallo-beta-lactamase [Mucilaginibacter sp. AK015]|uniref:subclass B1 metallo-beta-lactamase n=1 Tax=Mucilaginibacter sp. AK015 TaxID=2723072 RepID=UPI00160707CE|nr:subclass B1 metallo-beta-lactamase [Mucilaginibacter sp. AK015]MBB5395446.1 metallo-beta-lactamase class B [Mucilaginibacter sp. AK015]